ncbi:MAG: replication initiation factor domain-containing protein [Cypionkella sp.]
MADGAAILGLPSSNRGVSENEQIGVIVDWFAASFDLFAILEGNGWDVDRATTALDLAGVVGFHAREVAAIVAGAFFGVAFVLGEVGRGRFHKWRVSLRNGSDEHVGLVEFGGEHTIRKDGTHTGRIELTGEGCRIYEASRTGDHAQRWLPVASLLGVASGRISRIDIAADDYTGSHPVAWALERYAAGEFDRRGQRPNARLIDDMGCNTGKTFYIGSRKSENLLRVYEKGKEQGHKESPWVRYEGQFNGSTRRPLPLDMLTAPAGYLLGAYPVLAFIEGMGERLRLLREQVIASASAAVEHFRRQYGPMLNAMLHAAQGDEETLARLVGGVSRPTLPGWCPTNDAASELLRVILFAREGNTQAEEAK